MNEWLAVFVWKLSGLDFERFENRWKDWVGVRVRVREGEQTKERNGKIFDREWVG